MEEKIKRLENELQSYKSIAESQSQEIDLLAQILARSLTERELALLQLPAAVQVLLKFKCESSNA